MKFAMFNKQSTSKTPAGSVEERLDRLEAACRQLALEWEDTYERVMRALRRLNKRHQDLAAREDREESAQEPPGDTNGNGSGLDPISAKILARRARVSSRPDGSG